MAPEVLQGTGHGVAVDWWSFGTLIFEMLVGTPPFYSRNLQTMYRAILHGEVRFPSSMSKTVRSLLVGLLCRDASHRLGTNGGAKQIQRHPFFRSLDFKRVYQRGYEPSFVPQLRSPEDTAHFDAAFTSEPITNSSRDCSDHGIVEKSADPFEGWESTCEHGARQCSGSIQSRNAISRKGNSSRSALACSTATSSTAIPSGGDGARGDHCVVPPTSIQQSPDSSQPITPSDW